jgi:hypothetical protein
MPRVSFTLRSDADAQGSYLGGTADTLPARPDYDFALRADNLQLAPNQSILAEGRSFFEASSSCYGEVDLGWDVWGLPLAEDFVLPTNPDVVGIVLVYSDQGDPQTIGAGDILYEGHASTRFIHTGVPEGKWAYYSLFVHYLSSLGDSYYERVASIPVLVPRDYGSTLQLWRRIPEYYRIQDSNMGTTDYPPCIGQVDMTGKVGPLFKYLSIFGFDMDRMRTILDYTMDSRDPDVAHTEILDALAEQMGIPMRSSDLGASRLRRVLGDIGEYRRSKGTASALEYLGQAITGGDVHVDQDTGNITVFSQRVNYITDPLDATGLVTHRPAGNVEITTPLAFSSSTYNAASAGYSYTGSSFVPNAGSASAGVDCVMINISSPIPARPGDRVCFSVHSGVGTDAIKWARLVRADNTDTVVGWQTAPTLADGARAFEIAADTGASVGVWTNTKIQLQVDLRDAPSGFKLEYLLAELNRLDRYFDGNTVRGGWLIDASSVSDYRWKGSAYSSVSIYAEDYVRTSGILDSMLIQEAVPINEESSFQIVEYNAVPPLWPPGPFLFNDPVYGTFDGPGQFT